MFSRIENDNHYNFTNIISNVFLDFPVNGQASNVLTGVSCTTGHNRSSAGHITLVKAESDNMIPPNAIERNGIDSFINEHPFIKDGYKKLNKIT